MRASQSVQYFTGAVAAEAGAVAWLWLAAMADYRLIAVSLIIAQLGRCKETGSNYAVGGEQMTCNDDKLRHKQNIKIQIKLHQKPAVS